MCGICGVYGLNDKRLIRKMSDVISHRGPDGEGYFIDDKIMLGHRRLSIIDLKTGNQPIFNEDKSICIIYNGEIYNFLELRDELEKNGHCFSTNSDTEVIVHSYEQYGFDCVKKFNGMFAFAIWDSRKNILFIARDRAGIKPLFYTIHNGIFLFSSEIKSILQYPEIKRIIDKESLHYFVNLRYVPKEKTFFSGIKKLLPGHYLILDGKQHDIKIKRFWELQINPENLSENYFVKALKVSLDKSIKRQLVSDVPIASYLSGGIDSSTIVAFASKYKKNLQTFCMGFDEPDDEFNDARIVAEKFSTEHKELTVKLDILKSIPETIWHIDMPKRNMWPYFISEQISKHVKVVLSGLGGDEVFAGYVGRYNVMDGLQKKRKSVSESDMKNAGELIRKQLNSENIDDDFGLIENEKIHSIKDNAETYSLITHYAKLYSNPEYLAKVYSENLDAKKLPQIKEVFSPYFQKDLNAIDGTLNAEFNTKMPDDFLLVEDACTMAHSLEGRVPFLDNEIIDLGFRIPVGMKFSDGEGKLILKKAMKDILPKQIIEKKKQGFAPNINSWYKNYFREFALENFPKSKIIKENFNMNYISKILESKISDKMAMHYNLIWDLICVDVWNKIYIEGDEMFKPELEIDKMF